MLCLYAGDGQRVDTGAVDGQAGEGSGGPSLQDVINNAVAPLRIKREFIEAEGDNMDVEADAGNIEVVGWYSQPSSSWRTAARTTRWRTSGISTVRGWMLRRTSPSPSWTTLTTLSGGCA
jgi:hypothetical protein